MNKSSFLTPHINFKQFRITSEHLRRAARLSEPILNNKAGGMERPQTSNLNPNNGAPQSLLLNEVVAIISNQIISLTCYPLLLEYEEIIHPIHAETMKL